MKLGVVRADIEITSIKSTVMNQWLEKSVYKHLMPSKIRKQKQMLWKNPSKTGLIITQGNVSVIMLHGKFNTVS